MAKRKPKRKRPKNEHAARMDRFAPCAVCHEPTGSRPVDGETMGDFMEFEDGTRHHFPSSICDGNRLRKLEERVDAIERGRWRERFGMDPMDGW